MKNNKIEYSFSDLNFFSLLRYRLKNVLIDKIDNIDNLKIEKNYIDFLNQSHYISENEKNIIKEIEIDKKNVNKNNTSIYNLYMFFILLYISICLFNPILFIFLFPLLGLIVVSLRISLIEPSKNEKIKEIYINFLKENIDEYLPLNKMELENIYNENKFIKAYIDKNPKEIFTKHCLYEAAGLNKNNISRINEFSGLIDNKKILLLLNLSEGQKIIAEKTILEEQNRIKYGKF